MPNKQDALAALLSIQSKPKTILPPTEEAPRPNLGGGTAGAVLRIRDRQRATEFQQQVAPASVHQPDSYEREYWNQKAQEKAEHTKRQRIAEEKRRVEECREAARQRNKVDDEERADRNNRTVQHNMFASEVRSILHDATGAETESVLALVREWKMTTLPFAYDIALKTVREQASKGRRGDGTSER